MEYFDRVLSDEKEIIPSADFSRNVMEAVRREASSPMPIPFPWKRALPGLLLVALVLTVLAFVPGPLKHTGKAQLPTIQLAAMLMSSLEIMKRFYVDWIFGSLLLTWTCVNLTMRLASLGNQSKQI